jgi:hypothetical protein
MLRLSAIVVVMLLGLAFAGWSLLWNAAAGKTSAVLDSWIGNEAQLGRAWSCPGRRIGGYPLDIEVACPDLQFHGALRATDFAGSLRGFRAGATVLQPDRVTVRADAPLTLKTSDGGIDVGLDWTSLAVKIEGRPGALARLAIDGAGFAAKGSAAGLGPIDARAQSLRASVAPAPDASEATLDLHIALIGAAMPSVAGPLGIAAPLDAVIDGAITQADLSMAGDLAKRMEAWRGAGGSLALNTARVTSGPAHFNASGVLVLDEAHRPRGNLDAAFEGLDPFLRGLGVDPQIIAASSALTRFLRNSSGKPDSGEALRLPLRFSDGWVSIGPIRTPLRIPPLY